MNTPVCPITSKPLTQPGATVHPEAWNLIMPWLNQLATYMDAAQDALGKRLRIQDPNSGKPAIPDTTIPINLALLEPLWIIRYNLLTWTSEAARHLHTNVPPTWGTIGAFWKIHRHTLTRWKLAPQAIDELADTYRITLRVIDRKTTTNILGLCPHCQKPAYMPRHAQTLNCYTCSTSFTRSEGRDQAVQAIAYLWLPASQALTATRLITGKEPPSPETLRQWAHRQKIETRPYQGHNLYQPAQIVRHATPKT